MALADDLAKLEAELAIQRNRFTPVEYVLKNHLRTFYYAHANYISSGNAIPPVVAERKAQSQIATPGQDDPTQ